MYLNIEALLRAKGLNSQTPHELQALKHCNPCVEREMVAAGTEAVETQRYQLPASKLSTPLERWRPLPASDLSDRRKKRANTLIAKIYVTISVLPWTP